MIFLSAVVLCVDFAKGFVEFSSVPERLVREAEIHFSAHVTHGFCLFDCVVIGMSCVRRCGYCSSLVDALGCWCSLVDCSIFAGFSVYFVSGFCFFLCVLLL